MTSLLKTAAMGLGLFLLGAFVTALAIGKVSVAGNPNRAEIERVVQDYLLANPGLLVEMSNRLDNQQAAMADKNRRDALFEVGTAALIDPKIAYLSGPANAKVTVAEFFDYRCPYCKASIEAVKSLEGNPDVRVAFIERPILTPDSKLAAQAAVASRRQAGKYMPFHYALMATNGELTRERILEVAKGVGLDTDRLAKDMDDPEVLASIEASTALANKLHLEGTPTFVINDQILVGRVTPEQLRDITNRIKG
jgi:protein-disulfide isomerase